MVTDPPYSSGGLFASDRQGKTSVKYVNSNSFKVYPEFAGDNRDQRSHGYWSSLWLSLAFARTQANGYCAVFTDWRQFPVTSDALQAGGWVWRGSVVWDKTEACRPVRGRFRSQAEYVLVGSKGRFPLSGPSPAGVIRCRVNPKEKQHIAGKPVSVMDHLLSIARPGSVVLDPFMGSASTGVASLPRGLRFIGIESDPAYYEVACRRLREAG